MRSFFASFSIGAVFAVVLAGCSSSSSSSNPGDAGNDGNPTPVSADQACSDAVGALCDEIQKCVPFLGDLIYGDAATCRARAILGCTDNFKTNGNGGTPDQLEACGKAVPSIACSDFNAGLNGTGLRNALQSQSACAPVAGTLPNGAACATDGQCQSSFCATDKNAFCGTCAATPKAGDSCVNGTSVTGCGTGLVCSTAGKCETPTAAGGSCTDDNDCVAGLHCYQSKCTNGGKEGDTCDLNAKAPTAPNCDGFSGLGCKLTFPITTLVGKCAKITEAHVGDPCNLAKLEICVGGAWCSGLSSSDPSKDGTCAAPADDGAACDPTKGPTCKPGAKCVGGVCKIADPLSCK